ncbi:Hypothetical_protein [Hexamita inflata]|uniref:Hypothetical_protein n=1 Tax=Hexamita inflata TaxID=28002 RepID=A0AA86Q6X7_9EUKA|nr:Hypothetical protein HINF_LOCUS41194 [Hexamita inflata]
MNFCDACLSLSSPLRLIQLENNVQCLNCTRIFSGYEFKDFKPDRSFLCNICAQQFNACPRCICNSSGQQVIIKKRKIISVNNKQFIPLSFCSLNQQLQTKQGFCSSKNVLNGRKMEINEFLNVLSEKGVPVVNGKVLTVEDVAFFNE